MNLFRYYNRVKIQDENWSRFTSLIPELIEKAKESEPDMVQFEAFINNDKLE